jgi:hypothetical protein
VSWVATASLSTLEANRLARSHGRHRPGTNRPSSELIPPLDAMGEGGEQVTVAGLAARAGIFRSWRSDGPFISWKCRCGAFAARAELTVVDEAQTELRQCEGCKRGKDGRFEGLKFGVGGGASCQVFELE